MPTPDAWIEEDGIREPFPAKASSLPFGAKVWVEVLRSGEKWLVKRWEVLEHPQEIAQREAMVSVSNSDSHHQGGGYSASDYLKARYVYFAATNHHPASTRKSTPARSLSNMQGVTDTADDGHGDKQAKSMRSKVFAQWIVEQMGIERLRGGSVIDVAGGRGQASIELSIQSQASCTVIDPMQRKRLVSKRDLKRLKKIDGPVPTFRSEWFSKDSALTDPLIQDATLVIGLHPDQCTEDILDVALALNKPVAIVPCCVYASFFPMRTVGKTGAPVNSYGEFCEYLLEKDPARLRMKELPFEGKNRVIYWFGSDQD